MKKLLIAVASLLSSSAYARLEIAPDSISNTLDEVVVTADSKMETAQKVILRPTKLDKKHSTNGYSLLENMNLPDFMVNASAKTITTESGRDVRILINGMEADPDELATLAASEIMQIDYQRNPGGRYVGSGAVINFLTTRYEYGGNVYLSADEGLARQYGNYIGMVNYKRKSLTLTLTANGRWENSSQLNSADNHFMLNDGILDQSISPIGNKTRSASCYANFKVAHSAENHSFDTSLALTRSAVPESFTEDAVIYTGLYDFTSSASRISKERGISPVLKLH